MRGLITRISVGFCFVLLVSCVCDVARAATIIRTVNASNNDLGYDKTNNRFYVSRPSSAGASGNSLQIIDPVAGALFGSPLFVGSEPNKIAVSDNGQYAYVGLDGAAAVRRVDLSSFTAGLQFLLGSDSFLGPFYVDDMEVMPGSPQTLAVSRRNQGFSPRHMGVGIYDDGVVRPTVTPTHTGSNVIEFGANPSILYGYNNETTDFGFRTMSINASGVTITNSTAGLISGFGSDFDYGGGKVVSTTGKVIDPVNRTLLGTLGSTGPVAVEPDGSRAYVLSGSTINIYSLSTFLSLGSIPVPGFAGTEVIRWGSDGLALRNANQVVLVNSSLVPEPATAAIGLLPALAVALRRRPRAV